MDVNQENKELKEEQTTEISKEDMDYGVADIAKILHISRTTATRLFRSKEFPGEKAGDSYRISKKEFDDWRSTHRAVCLANIDR